MIKSLLCGFLFTAALFIAKPVQADNAYDLFYRALQPIVAVLASDSDGASLLATGSVSLPGQDFEPVGWRLFLEPPDRLRLEWVREEAPVIVVRDGQEVWCSPWEEIESNLSPNVKEALLAPGEPLPDMRLPFDTQTLTLFPAFFRVEDAGPVEIGDQTGRRLRARLIPEVDKGLPGGPWEAELWIQDGQLRVLVLKNSGPALRLVFGEIRFSGPLPGNYWQAGEDDSPQQVGYNAGVLEALIQEYDR